MRNSFGQAKIGLVLIVLVFVGLIVAGIFRNNNPKVKPNNFTGVSNNSENTTATSSAGNGSVATEENQVKLADNYFVFTQSSFDSARTYKQPIFLFFYSDKSTDSVDQEKVVVATFNGVTKNSIVGFRVDIGDDKVSPAESTLAKKYNVGEPLTILVFDKDGKQSDKFTKRVDQAALATAINKVNTIR